MDFSARQLLERLVGFPTVSDQSNLELVGLFQERGHSTVVCGPGDIAQAHQPNEFISVDQSQKGEVFVKRLVDDLCR